MATAHQRLGAYGHRAEAWRKCAGASGHDGSPTPKQFRGSWGRRRGGCWGDGVTSVAWLDEDTDTSLSSWPFELPTMTCYLLLIIKMTGEFATLQVRGRCPR